MTKKEQQRLILEEENTCAGCGEHVYVPAGYDFNIGDLCWDCHYKRCEKIEKLLERWYMNYDLGDIPTASLISQTKSILKIKKH